MRIEPLLIIPILAIYFTPSIVAGKRNHRNFNSIFILNLLLGWTFIGWVVALVWACSSDNAPSQSAPSQVEKPASTKKCPYCAEEIKKEAIVCRFCGRDQEAPAQA